MTDVLKSLEAALWQLRDHVRWTFKDGENDDFKNFAQFASEWVDEQYAIVKKAVKEASHP